MRNGGKDVHLFELGRVFGREGKGQDERVNFAMLSTGLLAPPHWTQGDLGKADFFSMKGAVEACLETAGLSVDFRKPSSEDVRFHPTRWASVALGGTEVGIMGQIHPDLAQSIGLPMETLLAEIAVDSLYETQLDEGELHYRIISRNPSVRRDIAVEISKDVPYAKIEAAVSEAASELADEKPARNKRW